MQQPINVFVAQTNMAITLANVRDEVRANLKSSLIATARIDLWANLSQDELWRSIDPEYGKETSTFPTVSGTRLYRFEASIDKILSVVDQTNQLRLVQTSETDIERFDADLNDSGSPNYYTLYGLDYISNQPSAASVITVVSSSALDTTQTVHIVGTSSGVEVSETLTLNGIGAVAGAVSFTSLRKISKSATTTGRVTATSNAAVVTNVVISPRRLIREFQPIRLWPVPSAVSTILVRYIRNPVRMVDAGDIPDLPEVWHSVLLDLVLAHGHEFLYEFDAATRRRNMVEKFLGDLRATNSHKRDKAAVIGGTRFAYGIGRLPPNYPLS